ncbi:hypothetical protein WDU94_015260 [Cyamophila willieti]
MYSVQFSIFNKYVPKLYLAYCLLVFVPPSECYGKAEPIRVVITGAAGQIAYSLIYQIAKGDVFGPNQPVILHLLDITPMMGVLEGVVMEISDCALPLVRGVVPTDKPEVAFKDVEAAFMVGAMPRKEGMERKDLLSANIKIFKVQGDALDKHAKKTVKVLVVGNPANTNALICSKYAPSIPKENFSAMTRLDQNRAQAHIAAKLGIPVDQVKNVIIWGNHSKTQYPDVRNATVIMPNGATLSVHDAIKDEEYLKNVFVEGLKVDDFAQKKLDLTAQELLEEKQEALSVCQD